MICGENLVISSEIERDMGGGGWSMEGVVGLLKKVKVIIPGDSHVVEMHHIQKILTLLCWPQLLLEEKKG